MNNKRFLALIAIPAFALSLAACSADEDTNPGIESLTESVPLEDTSPVLTEPEGEDSSDEEVSSNGDSQTAEAAVEMVNAFYTELSDDSRLQKAQDTLPTNWQDAEPGEVAMPELNDAFKEVYDDLASQVDTEGVPGEEVDQLYAILHLSNSMHVVQADLLPEPNLTVDEVLFEDDAVLFNMSSVYEEGSTPGEPDAELNYKDNKWVFTFDSMMMN